MRRGGRPSSSTEPGRAPASTTIFVCLRRFFGPLISLPFDDRCAEEAGLIRLDLERSGRPIAPNDLLIAAIARAHDLVLVTHNSREFGRIPGLQLEDWETPGSAPRT